LSLKGRKKPSSKCVEEEWSLGTYDIIFRNERERERNLKNEDTHAEEEEEEERSRD
jgi:hypothetical protein